MQSYIYMIYIIYVYTYIHVYTQYVYTYIYTHRYKYIYIFPSSPVGFFMVFIMTRIRRHALLKTKLIWL